MNYEEKTISLLTQKINKMEPQLIRYEKALKKILCYYEDSSRSSPIGNTMAHMASAVLRVKPSASPH